MSGTSDEFLDEYLPQIRGYSFVAAPVTSTTITKASNLSEQRNINTLHPLRLFTSPQGVKCFEQIQQLSELWLVLSGPAIAFPLQDPFDFASCRLQKAGKKPVPVATDQAIGLGDGLARSFPLKKTYTRGSRSYVRKITLPVEDSVLIAMNGLPPSTPDPALPGGPYNWTVDRLSGLVTFDHAPASNIQLTAGYLFDVPVRFEADDSLQQILVAFETAGFSDLSFQEIRPCFAGGSR
jgi:uncharacterized protein (TIGR02217 family)